MGRTPKIRETLVGWVVIILCFSCDITSAHVKLNVPRVRLPYFETISVNFTLKVDTPGCYIWTVSRPDVVTITPSNTDGNPASDHDGTQCADSLMISTIPRLTSCCPATAIIFAEDVITKESVRCDVIVDKIASIQILTTTKELHLEEAPSRFHIQGFGSKDNELSTLDGVPFTWVLESAKHKETSTSIDPQSIMRFIPFSESPYNAPPGVGNLEAKRMQGDTVLLEGIKTGSAVVIAKVNDPSYKSLEARVRIIVVASLLLEPHEVWIAPGSTLPLKLFQIKHGKKYEVRLPSSVYTFNVANPEAASYDRETSTIKGLEYGTAVINVMDKNWVDELEEHSEALTAKIHVTEPKYLSLSVLPYKNWALVMGNEYEVVVDVFNFENQKIFVGDNIFIETKFDPTYFRVTNSSLNGTYHVGIPIKLGSAYVTAELVKIVLPNGNDWTPSPQPRVKTEMEIFQNIAINPKETVLPWDPNIMPKYELKWNPSGGNGNYVWSSSNTSVVTVSQVATGRSEWWGSSNVTVSTTVNPHMSNVARVHILPPTRMEIVEHIVEAEIGTAIQVPLAFYTIRPNDVNRTEVPYSSCLQLPIQVAIEDSNFVYDDKTHYPAMKPACVVLPIMGNALGQSRVTASYAVGHKYFEDSVVVSTFKPLQIVEPENGKIVLAIGSTKQIVFEGGPRPLLEKHSGFQKSLEILNETVAAYRALKSSSGLKDDVYIFEVVCKEIGVTDAVFKIGNTNIPEQSQPIIRVKGVQVICAEPVSMYFKVESSLKPKCPHDASSAQATRIAIPNYEPSLVSVVVKDKDGHKFDNITSLKIDWLAQPGYLEFGQSTHAETEPIHSSLGYIGTGKGLQTLHPNKVSADVEVIAKVKGYRSEVLAYHQIPSRKLIASTDDEWYDLEHSLDLRLVADVSVSPSTPVSLFNHPSSKVILKVNDGSGYFRLDTKGSDKINVSYNEVSKTLQIKPIRQGKSSIILTDLCVPSKRGLSIDVDVTGIGKIEVQADSKIPLDGERVLTVSLLDHNGKSLSPEIIQLSQLALRPMNFDILEIKPLDSEPVKGAVAKVQFKIIGKRLGSAEIVFTAENGNILSTPVSIDVFPRLRLSPREIRVLPGNLVRLAAHGGPNDADIVFSTSTEYKNIAAVQATVAVGGGILNSGMGTIKALGLGKAVVYARAVDPVSRKVYSEDFVEIRVVKLTALQVVVPLPYLYEDEKMPVWFNGMSGRFEFDRDLLATASPAISSISWEVSNEEYAEVNKIFEVTAGIGSDLRTQFHALKAGNITLQVSAYYGGDYIQSQKFVVDIRQYPFGSTTEQSGVMSLWLILKSAVASAYYWFLLPILLTVAVLFCSIAYNAYAFGTAPTTKVDTSLFISSPVFNSNTPTRYTPTSRPSVSPSNVSPSPNTRDYLISPNHRRLYSTSDSGLSAGSY